MRDVKEALITAEAAEVMLSKNITERIKCKDLKAYKYKARVVEFFEKVDAKLILFDIIILKRFSWKEVVLCQQ